MTNSDYVCDHCGESAHMLLGGECLTKCSTVSEYGDRLADAVKILRGEADELAERNDVDPHMQDVIDGLRHHADGIESFLNQEYYVSKSAEGGESA